MNRIEMYLTKLPKGITYRMLKYNLCYVYSPDEKYIRIYYRANRSILSIGDDTFDVNDTGLYAMYQILSLICKHIKTVVLDYNSGYDLIEYIENTIALSSSISDLEVDMIRGDVIDK